MTCKQGTALIIGQMTELLAKMDAGSFSRPLQLFNGSSIGQHFRHIIDFYGCLINGLRDGRIDYAKRERDTRIETEPAFASEVLHRIIEEIGQLDESVRVEVIADFSSDLNEERPLVASTAGRELMYAYDHAVHHLAMIKMGLKAAGPVITFDENLGVAPSTLKHWKSEGR